MKDTDTELFDLIGKMASYNAFMPKTGNFGQMYRASAFLMGVRQNVGDFGDDWQKLGDFVEDAFKNRQADCRFFYAEGKKALDEEFPKRMELLKKLPKEILDTVEDIRMLALGYMTEETHKALSRFRNN